MTRPLLTLCACTLCMAPIACVRHELSNAEPVAETRTAEQAAAALGNPLLANKGDINAVTVNVSSSEDLEKIDNGSDEELIWTDPDNPDAEIPGLSDAFQKKFQGNGWQDNFATAARLARRNELPLIIWFHDSLLSPKSKELAKDYLDTAEFDNWCRDRVVRLRLDSGASLSDSSESQSLYSHHKINALKKFYGLKQKPAVAIISANGKIVARIDGYDGLLPYFINDLKAGVEEAQKEYRDYRQGLRRRGYRDWRSANGSKSVFAKVMRVDDAKQLVYLKEEGGRVTRTRFSSLSREDLDYIDDLRVKSMEKRRSKAMQKRLEDEEDDDTL